MKTALRIIAVIFLIGGVMGLAKGLLPQLEWLNFRSLLGAGGSTDHPAFMLAIERVYGIVMAALEVLMAVLLLVFGLKHFKLALAVTGINTLGCVVAVIVGDMFAIVSLLVRIAVIILLVHVFRREKATRQDAGAMEG